MASNEVVEEMGRANVVNCLYRYPGSAFKLICFPWAGGGSNHFAKWGKTFPHSIEVSSIRLPGRECRSKEPFATNINLLVGEISNVLLPMLQDVPFAFFGHSMGVYLAFLTALHLKDNYKLQPVHFFVSSGTPPHKMDFLSFPDMSSVSEDQIIHFFMNNGGTPKEVLENKELLEIFFPIFKGDIQLLKSYFFAKPSKALLSCDITCFSGTEEVGNEVEGWKELTSGNVESHKLPGGHFYLTNPSNETFIAHYITRCLEISDLA
ncbi:S-acyl fatty acid synthase thioesterase, medium chain [Macrotis lagotis]|uniref:S-acyl fatty acid synthase thioesterase, medium chain n=1 Tax=Macrotis lagotis TaxID=92651 RepID=UPI003D697B0D